jgi:hypothetical protein
MVAGGHVKAPIAPIHFAKEKKGAKEIARDLLVTRPGQSAGVRLLTQEKFNPMAPRKQFVHKIGADEPGRAGNEAFHKKLQLILRKALIIFHKKFFTA